MKIDARLIGLAAGSACLGFGAALGFLKELGKGENTAQAYRLAIRLSRWGGVLFTLWLFGVGIQSINLDQQLAPFLFLGAAAWAPILGAVFCWTIRPLIYLPAYYFYRRPRAEGNK